MKEFVEYLVKQLVDRPEDVVVKEIMGENSIIYELNVNQVDKGHVIGRRGKTIDAIRILVNAVCRKEGKGSEVSLVDDRRYKRPEFF